MKYPNPLNFEFFHFHPAASPAQFVPKMTDPTEPVIIATFCSALGIFAITAAIRQLMGKIKFPEPPPPLPVTVFLDPTEDFALPPSLPDPPVYPSHRNGIATWFYRPFDLLGMGFVFTIFFGLVVANIRMGEKAENALDASGLVASIAFQYVSAGIVACFVISRVRPIQWLGLKWRHWPWALLIAPCTVLAMWALFAGLQVSGFTEWIESLGVPTVQDTVKLLQESNDPRMLALMAIAAVVAAPMCEEIIFRGYLYPAAKTFAGPWVAGICSAMVFAAAHGNLAALLPLFIFGCVLVLIYEKTGSIWAPMSVHCCFNLATVLIQFAMRNNLLPVDPSS